MRIINNLRCFCLFVDISVVSQRPVINAMSPDVGPRAGSSVITVNGYNLDVYPALGAYFVDSKLPTLYGYVQLNSR